jgi:hypothetical protein
MKTTIEIPEPLYKRAKIRAIETGQTLRQLVLHALSRELDPASTTGAGGVPPSWQRRKLLPAYERAMRAGAYRPPRGASDITEMIAEDRDGR